MMKIFSGGAMLYKVVQTVKTGKEVREGLTEKNIHSGKRTTKLENKRNFKFT